MKRWAVACDNRIDPLARQLEAMYNLLAGEVPRAIAHLSQALGALSDYADRTQGGVSRASSSPPSSVAADSASQAPGRGEVTP